MVFFHLQQHLPLPVELIERRTFLIRGHKVMLDSGLASRTVPGPTFRLSEAVKRKRNRFPEDFMFQLTKEEAGSFTSQIAMSKPGCRGGRRTLRLCFH